MKTKNLFQSLINYFIFKGNVNRLEFMVTLLFAGLIYVIIGNIIVSSGFSLRLSGIYMGVAYCYLFGISIAARLRNLKLNPSLTYFWVFLLWFFHFVIIEFRPVSRDFTVELVYMLKLFTILPLFAKNKKVLQFWKD